MSSSRESNSSYESDSEFTDESGVGSLGESESLASDEELKFKPIHLVYTLIMLQKANAEVMLRFSITSFSNQLWVFNWLAENMHILGQPGNGWLLLSVENILKADDERAEFVAKCMANNFSYVGMKVAITSNTLERVIVASLNSGYLTPAFQSSICNNAATLFGNHLSFRLMIKHGFVHSDFSGKIKEMYYLALEKDDMNKADNFLTTLRVQTEHNLKKMLERVKNKIKNFNFVLHNGGGVIVDGVEHKMPTHAATVFGIVCEALKSDSPLISSYPEFAKKMKDQLIVNEGDKAKEASISQYLMSWFPTTGVRDSSTTAFYEKIISILDEGTQALSDYERVARTRSLCTGNEPSVKH